MAKVQTQLLVNPGTRDRANALALVRGEPRAETLRGLVDRALPGLEKAEATALAELDELAARFKMTRAELATRALDDRLSMSDLREMRRYPRSSAGKA